VAPSGRRQPSRCPISRPAAHACNDAVERCPATARFSNTRKPWRTARHRRADRILPNRLSTLSALGDPLRRRRDQPTPNAGREGNRDVLVFGCGAGFGRAQAVGRWRATSLSQPSTAGSHNGCGLSVDGMKG
jgi:hypothetical protein